MHGRFQKCPTLVKTVKFGRDIGSQSWNPAFYPLRSPDPLPSASGSGLLTSPTPSLIAVEASDQPVREEHSHEAQGGQLHPPALLCQHHVQLCQGNPQQEDSEQVIFLLLSKVYSQPTGVKSKQTSQYPGSTFTRLWESWKRELAELKFFRKNMEAPFQFSRWLGGYLKQFELTFSN